MKKHAPPTEREARNRALEGRAVLVEDAGVVLQIHDGQLVVHKEYADGHRVACARFAIAELGDAHAPERPTRRLSP